MSEDTENLLTEEQEDDLFNETLADVSNDAADTIEAIEGETEEIVKVETVEPEETRETSEALKAENERLRRVNLSMSGRVSATQKAINDLEARIAAPPQVPPSAAKLGEEFNTLKEEFEGLDSVENALQSQQSFISGQSGQINNLAEQVHFLSAGLRQEKARHEVEKIYKNFDEIRGSQEFRAWRNALPPEEQSMVASTNDGQTILQVLDTFIKSTGYKDRTTQVNEATKTKAERDRALAASLGVKTKKGATIVNKAMPGSIDEEKLFKEAYNKILTGASM